MRRALRETVNQEGRLEKSGQYDEFLSQSVLARAAAYRSKYEGVSVTGTLARFSLSPLVDTLLHVQTAPSVSSLWGKNGRQRRDMSPNLISEEYCLVQIILVPFIVEECPRKFCLSRKVWAARSA